MKRSLLVWRAVSRRLRAPPVDASPARPDRAETRAVRGDDPEAASRGPGGVSRGGRSGPGLSAAGRGGRGGRRCWRRASCCCCRGGGGRRRAAGGGRGRGWGGRGRTACGGEEAEAPEAAKGGQQQRREGGRGGGALSAARSEALFRAWGFSAAASRRAGGAKGAHDACNDDMFLREELPEKRLPRDRSYGFRACCADPQRCSVSTCVALRARGATTKPQVPRKSP